ncbi:MAG: DUF4430 domain-containing protein [Bacillota bacterium]
MQRKIFYTVFFLVIIAAVMGPAIYSGKIAGHKQPDSPEGGKAAGLKAGVQTAASRVNNGIREPAGGKPEQSTGVQADNVPAAGNKAGLKDKPAGLDGATPAREPAGNLPAEAMEDGCAVGIAVVGMDGELLYGPGNVTVTKKNMGEVTALGALDATGLPYTMSTRWSGFVEAVAGQRNKGQAGWMYKVNGEIPLVAADQKTVKAGDKVIWWYSKSMGDPAPNWDVLIKRGAGN